MRITTLLAASGRMRQHEGNIRFLDDRIRSAVHLANVIQQRQQQQEQEDRAQEQQQQQQVRGSRSQNQTQDRTLPSSASLSSRSTVPDRSSLASLLLFGLSIMLNERMRAVEDGGYAVSAARVFRILDDLLVLLLDPAFDDVFGSTGSGSAGEGVNSAATSSSSAGSGVNGNGSDQGSRRRGPGQRQDQQSQSRGRERNVESEDRFATVPLTGASEAA